MAISFGLHQRRLEPEILDQPGLDATAQQQALIGLARINFISASVYVLWRPIRALILRRQQAGDQRTVRVLDVATGGGDLALCLRRRAKANGLPLEVVGCDCNPVAIEHARASAIRRQVDGVSFFQLDALREPFPDDFDVITSSLFLHHLDEEAAVAFLRKMRESARELALVNDLIRSRLGWCLAFFGTRVLSRSPIVHNDGLLSVQAAFTMAEAMELASKAGWENAQIKWRWPFRFLLANAQGARAV